MVDFCLECNDFMFGHEIECGLAGLITKEKVNEGYVVNVLCEGCGFIAVDHNGQKVPWSDE